jgi:hypothetical protein
MSLFHIGAVWALIDFTWSGVAVLIATYYVSLAWGIGMSYHRLLTHRSYKTSKPVEYFLTICATLALEGGRCSGWPLIGSIISTPTPTRSAHAAPRRLLGAHRLDHVRHDGTQRRPRHARVRAGPGQGSRSTDSSAPITGSR